MHERGEGAKDGKWGKGWKWVWNMCVFDFLPKFVEKLIENEFCNQSRYTFYIWKIILSDFERDELKKFLIKIQGTKLVNFHSCCAILQHGCLDVTIRPRGLVWLQILTCWLVILTELCIYSLLIIAQQWKIKTLLRFYSCSLKFQNYQVY